MYTICPEIFRLLGDLILSDCVNSFCMLYVNFKVNGYTDKGDNTVRNVLSPFSKETTLKL